MRRSNTFVVRPLTDRDEELLRTLLDASACLWNQLNYERLEQLNAGESVWETADYRKRYVGILGSATAQQVIRKNSEAWRSFFAAKEAGEPAGPPGFWGNREEGRELRTYIRNDQYTLETGDRSRSRFRSVRISRRSMVSLTTNGFASRSAGTRNGRANRVA